MDYCARYREGFTSPAIEGVEMNSADGRLLLAKYLYIRGADILRAGGLFDAGLAVSLFQDAVEMAVFACGARYNAQPRDNGGFFDAWEATDRALATADKPALKMK